ncbi:MAG: exosome complex RNA-binding protein Csl4, partial [Candidatus Diapherotrites archaeon]
MTKKEFVYPGIVLCTEEEFLAGKNTYSDENGNVISETLGFAEFDNKDHEARVVSQKNNINILRKGCHVIGMVVSVKPTNVLVQILEAIEKGIIVHDSNGSIAIFNIADSFVKNTEEMFRIGDIVKAKVVA